MSEPVAPCPTCPEGWRPLDKEHCPDCYEGRIEQLKARIEALEASHLWQFVRKLEQDNDQLEARSEALEAALREIKDQYLFPNQSSAIARAALDKERKS